MQHQPRFEKELHASHCRAFLQRAQGFIRIPDSGTSKYCGLTNLSLGLWADETTSTAVRHLASAFSASVRPVCRTRSPECNGIWTDRRPMESGSSVQLHFREKAKMVE